MTATDIATRPTTALSEQMTYAKAVASADLLPDAYRGKPANVLIAIGLGQQMGLSPAESLYRINVIKGKPTAGAELIASNVRKAGHKLRVTLTDTSATCTIIRADDPKFPFEVTRDIEWARSMGLASNDNYKKQAATMLQWRAITACARLACPEALYGVSYTPDEMYDLSASHAAPEPVVTETIEAEVTDAETEPETPADDRLPRLWHAMKQAGIADKEKALTWLSERLGVEIKASTDVTPDDADVLLALLEAEAQS